MSLSDKEDISKLKRYLEYDHSNEGNTVDTCHVLCEILLKSDELSKQEGMELLGFIQKIVAKLNLDRVRLNLYENWFGFIEDKYS